MIDIRKKHLFMEVCSLRTRSHYCFITINDKRLVSFVLVISVEVQMQIQCIVLYLTYLTCTFNLQCKTILN